MKIQESAENYLETILMLMERNGQVRSIDIATEMGFSKPSVSVAMKKLREGGYIRVDEDGLIHLEPAGRKIAEKIYDRHKTLAKIFISLGVDETIAFDDACRIEHVLSTETYQRLKAYFKVDD